MVELADEVVDTGSVAEAPIPDSAPEPIIHAEVADQTTKPEKLSIRQALEKSVEKVRADEKGRLHANDGKFTPKEKSVEPKAPAETQATVKDAQPNEASKPIGPPPGWSAESKAVFATLPDPVKQDILKREKEVSDGFKQKSDEIKRFQEIEQVLAPSRAVYQGHGIKSDAEAVSRLFQWEAAIRNNPVQGILGLARQYGVNLSQFSPQSGTPSMEQEIPAHLRPVIDGYGQIRQTVDSLQSELQRNREEQVSKTLTDFSKDKTHFDKVRVRMGQLIQAGAATDLDGAYQQAIWADPEIRSILMKEQVDKETADRQKAQTQRANAARAAAISSPSRPPSGALNGATSGKKGVRESLLASIREIQDDRA